MKNIRKMNIHSFAYGTEDVLRIDDDFYIFEQSDIPYTGYPFKTDVSMCCLCISGEAHGKINLTEFKLERHSFCIMIQHQILEIERISKDFRCIFILMSERFVGNLGLPFNFTVHKSVIDSPVIHLSDRQYAAMKTYCDMVKGVLTVEHPNGSEIIRHLTCAFFYGIGYYFHQASDKPMSNDEILLRRFLTEVEAAYKRERKLAYYAEKMCITPKYLSTVIKQYSGKSASEWIDEYVALEAKALLKSTNLTIQQISMELNFPSQTFFGKYFKRVTGMSPREYRE